MTPFRDDAVWRQQRAAELQADHAELEVTLARAEASLRATRAKNGLFLKAKSIVGVILIALALGGGYAVGRWCMGHHAYECT